MLLPCEYSKVVDQNMIDFYQFAYIHILQSEPSHFTTGHNFSPVFSPPWSVDISSSAPHVSQH